MNLYRIAIRNFRNLRSFDWKPDPRINVLFGPNGCGKTNIAEALSLLFTSTNYDSFFETSDFYLGDENNHISIQVWLDGIDELPTNYSECLQHIDCKDNFVTDDIAADTKAVLIYHLESGDDRRMEWSFFQQTQKSACRASSRKAVAYTHISADRQPLKEIGLNSKTIFYQMAEDSIGAEIARISKELMASADKALSSSTIINNYLDTLRHLGEIQLVEKYRLLLKDPTSTWNYSGYELGTSIGSSLLNFDKHSKGIQNLFLLLLMKKRLEGAGIVFIEELEQNLEPQNQRYIANVFRSMNVGQLFITSHSPDIISDFKYENVSVVSADTVKKLFDGLTDAMKKEIYRFNKKEFITALMSSRILLVEGVSEGSAFPIFAQNSDVDLKKYDLDVLQVGGKGKLELYCQALKRFGKTVYVLIDNDSDVQVLINKLSRNADEVLVSMDSYEDLIYPNADAFISCMEELVPFSVVSNKLCRIMTCQTSPDTQKANLIQDMSMHRLDPATMSSYCDLKPFACPFKYALHDSFATPYFARAIAQQIVDSGTLPVFFQRLIEHVSNNGCRLSLYSTDNQNVYRLTGA